MSTMHRDDRVESQSTEARTDAHITPAELLAGVVRERIESVIRQSRGDRVVYAVVDLSIDITSAIGRAVSEIRPPDGGRVEVAIHPDLADSAIQEWLLSNDVATRFRNRRDVKTVATVFSVPGSQIEGVIQSLGGVQRINDAWLCDPTKAELWTSRTIPNYHGEIVDHLTHIVQGIMRSDILSSAEMLAAFCAQVRKNMLGSAGLPLPRAINHALPCLHLPRNSMSSMSSEKLASTAAVQFRQLRNELQPHLYLTSRKGELRSFRELKADLKKLQDGESIKSEHAEKISKLINDHNLTAGSWQVSQQHVAEISWADIRQFFERSPRKPSHIGRETIEFLDDEFPKSLNDDERATLEKLRHRSSGGDSDYQEIFVRHCERIRSAPLLYRRWQVMIFDKPIEETDDLIVGLMRLAERAYQRASKNGDSVLYVRLRDSEKKSFWQRDKNWYLCTYLRDRYRGLAAVMEPNVVLDFGRCWEEGILDGIADPRSTGSKNAIFEFEAHVVGRSDLPEILNDRRRLARQHRAQLIWKPGHMSFATSLSADLDRILPKDRKLAALVSSSVTVARAAKGTATQRATLWSKSSIIDVLGETGGSLVDRHMGSSRLGVIRIDQDWKLEFDRLAKGTVRDCDRGEIQKLFDEFHREYSNAISAMTRPGGSGLNDPSMVAQAKCYGQLLAKLRRVARTDSLVRKVWVLLLQIGTAEIEGDPAALIVTPWHPLRLLELAAKARQATSVICCVMRGSVDQSVSVADYVGDRVLALQRSYYLDVGMTERGASSDLLVETEAHAGYSLLESPSLQSSDRLVDVPVGDAVARFGEIADEYLRQRPHERANFSTVLLDAESEELPALVAKHLAREIDDEPHLRCELTVTHENSRKLRQIYERQNRRIGHEIESSLTSEAARMFMSRLRVGIAPAATVHQPKGVKSQDIVLLHDVIERYAKLIWDKVAAPVNLEDPSDHAPNDTSRRKSPARGSLTSSVYLTAPLQIQPSQAYLDVLHDVLQRTASSADEHYVPSHAIDLQSPNIRGKLDIAHCMAHWVVTYDRIADRRLLASARSGVRILRYYSSPRSAHNVIVSTEIGREDLRTRLQEELEQILPDYGTDMLNSLVAAVQRQAIDLAGGIVMRGRHWDNYARELIGVVVAQRELKLLLDSLGEGRTAMFYLDEFKSWLDLSGEIADIIAVNFYTDQHASPKVRLVVAEAKCVNESASFGSKVKSWTQLEATYVAITNRFTTDDRAIDPSVWRNRLADMLVEHMSPWGEEEHLGGRSFDQWIELIRSGGIDFEVSGHAIVSVHDQPETQADLDLLTADGDKLPWKRRKLARWTLGADLIKGSIRNIESPDADPLLHIPTDWPEASCVQDQTPGQTTPVPPESPVPVPPVVDPPNNGTERGGNETTSDGTSRGAGLVAKPTPSPSDPGNGPAVVPAGWKRAVYEALVGMSKSQDNRQGQEWLKSQVAMLRQALQAENMEARIDGASLTPNAGLVKIDGRVVTVKWLSGKQVDLLTRYGIDIVRITPQPGRIVVAIRRPQRAILHLADAWRRRMLQYGSPHSNMAVLVGEQEDDGELYYLSFSEDFAGRERAAPHTLVSGTTGSGKGILTSNLILDLCAFNHPRSVKIYLIDPKHGADYLWARCLPHLHGGIVAKKEEAIALLRRLVRTMEERYALITGDECANIDQYNNRRDTSDQLPRVVIFFDEVANWMQDDEFKREVEGVINEIATKSRAAGLHLFMIYQRADNQVMTMQLRTNLGNKLILRLGDEGSSKIALGEKGAERLLGKGHIIAKIGNDEKIYGQVPFIGENEIAALAAAIKRAWEEPQQ